MDSWMDSGDGRRGVEKERATREKRVCPGMGGSVCKGPNLVESVGEEEGGVGR